MADTIEIQSNVHLERLLMSNPQMHELVEQAVRNVLAAARKDTMADISAALSSDPRGAARAVRSTIYKSILGGNLNILRKKRAGKRASVPSSNRGRLDSTERIMSYRGSDRGFILRFNNAGTGERVAAHMNAKKIQRTQRTGSRTYRTGTIGSRGRLTGKNFFGPASNAAIKQASEQLILQIDQIISKQSNG